MCRPMTTVTLRRASWLSKNKWEYQDTTVDVGDVQDHYAGDIVEKVVALDEHVTMLKAENQARR